MPHVINPPPSFPFGNRCFLFPLSNQAKICYTPPTMSRSLTPIEISSIPDLVRLVEEVQATQTPRELQRDQKTVAVLMPPTAKALAKTQDKTRLHEALALA